MEIVVSGIRPTGNLHLGNYFGAVKNFVKMQENSDAYFFIADYHSLTTHPTPADLHGNVRSVLAQYLACGIDPEKACIYVQSDVPEVTELYLLLNMNAYLGELERVTSFKEKMNAKGNRCDLVLYKDQGHAFFAKKPIKYFIETTAKIDDFLEIHE